MQRGNGLVVPLRLRQKRSRLLRNDLFHVGETGENLIIDGQTYPRIETGNIPSAYCDVPVTLVDNGTIFYTIIIAGHLAAKAIGDGDTIRPAPGWFMFIKDTVTEERLKSELVVAK